MPHRKTLIAHGRLAALSLRKKLAEESAWGVCVLSFEQAAARLAGGFLRPIDQNELRLAIQRVFPEVHLGELEGIKPLPGLVRAAAQTFRKAWRANLDLRARACAHARLEALATLESAVLKALPAGMLRPGDLVEQAMQRLEHAPTIFGALEVIGATELSPCWRPLLLALAERIPVVWKAGPREAPAWLEGSKVVIERTQSAAPSIRLVSAATALHEAVESLRWARELIASGRAQPGDIAIAAASPADYDGCFLALRAEANFELRFVHGTSALASREGQTAAALADILVNGLSQARLRRLSSLASGALLFAQLPESWARVLPREAPLDRPAAWERFCIGLAAEDWPDGVDHSPVFKEIVARLSAGIDSAEAVGQAILEGRALSLWRGALNDGPAAAIESTLAEMRVDDCLEAPNAAVWAPASALAEWPRPFVRLLGLTSRAWPRLGSEDPLLPEHIVAMRDLEPLPIADADRRDFATILATTNNEIVLSRLRRDGEGRLLGKSPLLHTIQIEEHYLRRNRAAPHAMSESDRLFARSREFKATALAQCASRAWDDWRKSEVTAHDGKLRENHPAITQILAREHSATSLRKLLRDPLGFVWKYGLGLRPAPVAREPLTLDHRKFGDLLHRVLEIAVTRLETVSNLANCANNELEAAIRSALDDAAAEIEGEEAIPPFVVWRAALDEVQGLARHAIRPDAEALLDGQASFAEAPFGRSDFNKPVRSLPWDPTRTVEIAGAGLRIAGVIDRVDLSADRRVARVSDYKTGKPPDEEAAFILDGGKELQRCLYAFAVKALIGPETQVESALRYARADSVRKLDEPERTLVRLAGYLAAAKRAIEHGRIGPGPDAAEYNEFNFALPADKSYLARKFAGVRAMLGEEAAAIWDVE